MNCRKAINRWQKKNYSSLTQFLCAHKMNDKLSKSENKNKEYMQWTSAMNSLMKERNHTNYVYRGMNSKFINSSMEIKNFGFLATSSSISEAAKFGDIILKFKIPPDIKSYTFENKGEQEVLIQRNTKLVKIKPLNPPPTLKIKMMINHKFVFSAELVKLVNVSTPRNTSRNIDRLHQLKYNSSNENSNFSNNEN